MSSVDLFEEIFVCLWNKVRLVRCVYYGVIFIRVGLIVGEDVGMVVFEVVIKKFFIKIVVYVFLMCVVGVVGVVVLERVIKGEFFVFDDFVGFDVDFVVGEFVVVGWVEGGDLGDWVYVD